MTDQGSSGGNQRGPIVALGVIVLLLALGWLLARFLSNSSRIEDCLMSGRSNCAPIESQGR